MAGPLTVLGRFNPHLMTVAPVSERLPAHATPSAAMFELDRFELVGGERYEVEGRWSGVRGRVFMRPELTLIDGNHSRRILADLAGKPWQASDGDRWTVTFPCAADAIEVSDAELTVTPDIIVPVKRGRMRRTRAGKGNVNQKPSVPTQPAKQPRAREEAKTGAGGRRRGLGVQLAEAHSELEHLRHEHDRLSDRLDVATRRAEDARVERDRAAQIREELAAERDHAICARDDARAESDRVKREAAEGLKVVQRSRDEAMSELARTQHELERARETLLLLTSERDSAIRAGVEVERELHAASSERTDLLSERDQLAAENGFLQRELKRLSAAPPQVSAGYEPRPAQHGQPVRSLESTSSDFSWRASDRWPGSTSLALRSRAVALLALTAAVVVVVVLLVSVVF